MPLLNTIEVVRVSAPMNWRRFHDQRGAGGLDTPSHATYVSIRTVEVLGELLTTANLLSVGQSLPAGDPGAPSTCRWWQVDRWLVPGQRSWVHIFDPVRRGRRDLGDFARRDTGTDLLATIRRIALLGQERVANAWRLRQEMAASESEAQQRPPLVVVDDFGHRAGGHHPPAGCNGMNVDRAKDLRWIAIAQLQEYVLLLRHRDAAHGFLSRRRQFWCVTMNAWANSADHHDHPVTGEKHCERALGIGVSTSTAAFTRKPEAIQSWSPA